MTSASSLPLDTPRGQRLGHATPICSPNYHSTGTSVPEDSACFRSGLRRLAARLKSFPAQVKKFHVGAYRLAMAILNEIFDQSAYSRFLVRQRIGSSQTAYAAFLREQEVAKARRPRCC